MMKVDKIKIKKNIAILRFKDNIRKNLYYSYFKSIFKMYILADICWNCRNQDLYRNKDDFDLTQKNSYFFLFQNILYFVSESVKCIDDKMTIFIYIHI